VICSHQGSALAKQAHESNNGTPVADEDVPQLLELQHTKSTTKPAKQLLFAFLYPTGSQG
jgi:hypothetical protein